MMRRSRDAGEGRMASVEAGEVRCSTPVEGRMVGPAQGAVHH